MSEIVNDILDYKFDNIDERISALNGLDLSVARRKIFEYSFHPKYFDDNFNLHDNDIEEYKAYPKLLHKLKFYALYKIEHKSKKRFLYNYPMDNYYNEYAKAYYLTREDPSIIIEKKIEDTFNLNQKNTLECLRLIHNHKNNLNFIFDDLFNLLDENYDNKFQNAWPNINTNEYTTIKKWYVLHTIDIYIVRICKKAIRCEKLVNAVMSIMDDAVKFQLGEKIVESIKTKYLICLYHRGNLHEDEIYDHMFESLNRKKNVYNLFDCFVILLNKRNYKELSNIISSYYDVLLKINNHMHTPYGNHFMIVLSLIIERVDHDLKNKLLKDFYNEFALYKANSMKHKFCQQKAEDGNSLFHTDSEGERICVVCFENIIVQSDVTFCLRCNKYIGHSECIKAWARSLTKCPCCNQ
jgi:hypothetical protein